MRKHILIVDDERPIRELLKFKLARRGFRVATAKSAEEFWTKAMQSKFDLIILDIWLNGKLGTEVYAQLRNSGLNRNIPVVFVSALVEDSPPSHVRSGSQYAIYGKPLNLKKFLEDVDSLLNSKTPSTGGHEEKPYEMTGFREKHRGDEDQFHADIEL